MATFQSFSTIPVINSPVEFLANLRENRLKTVKNSKSIVYYNVPSAFDIETTSFFHSIGKDRKGFPINEKRAIMYEWSFGINGYITFGRYWSQFIDLLSEVADILKTDDKNRLIVFVHNLSFEFQFIRKRFEWQKVFALDTHEPLYALTTNGIEFRCSYLLSGMGLASLGKSLIKYPCEKMVGDLDYSLIRHGGTPLSEKELGYCFNDIQVVMCFIQERIERDGSIINIPLTKTGYVRKYCKKECLYNGAHKKSGKKYNKYRANIKPLTLTVDEYLQARRAFQGGFTHANAFNVNKVFTGVSSFDICSSYPTVLCAEMFPMSKGELYTPKDLDDLYTTMETYNCIFDVEFYGLNASTMIDHPLSLSKCLEERKTVVDNGRVVSADYVLTTITEQDFFVYEKFYEWQDFRVMNFYRYEKNYLPSEFVKAVLMLYKIKTELKGVEGAEEEYMLAKENINAMYGNMVTDIVRAIIEYDGDEWTTSEPNIEEAIERYNKKPDRVISYLWGVFVTAYARRNLFSMIYAVSMNDDGTENGDYIYADTDSTKILNAEKHTEAFEEYNEFVTYKLKMAMKWHGFPFEWTRPKTKDGREKPLGLFEFECKYDKFKTLGAKRYMYEIDGELNITVSGLNKKVCVPYLKEHYSDPFKAFDEDLYIPPEHTGKNIHTYIEYPVNGYLTDYLGNTEYYEEESAVHLAPSDYTLSISEQFADYLKGIKMVIK